MAMLSSAVTGEAATQAATQACHTTALTLLLRLLPFKQSSSTDTGQLLQHNRNALLDELHKHPLWRYSSLDEQSAYRTPPRIVVPQEAHDDLLPFVKMAAEAEDMHRPLSIHKYGRTGPVTAAEVAAELHAVYALAASHAITEQTRADRTSSKQLDSNELLALLSAYSALGESGKSRSGSSSTRPQPDSHYGRAASTWQEDTTTAAVQAVYAFAALADTAAQPQAGQLHSRPSAALAGKSTVGAEKHGGCNYSQVVSETTGYQISSSDAKRQDLEVLLQLARLAVPS